MYLSFGEGEKVAIPNVASMQRDVCLVWFGIFCFVLDLFGFESHFYRFFSVLAELRD